MIGTVALLLLAAAAPDPRPALVQMELDGQLKEALARTERELAERPQAARALGLDYLRGHLLDRLGDESASTAFITSLATIPRLALYSRYRLAQEHEQRGHPEVSAGLIATGLGAGLRSPILPDAVRMLARALDYGGDCRLLKTLPIDQMPAPERRILTLSRGKCALRQKSPEEARKIFAALLAERRDDEASRGAAELLAGLVNGTESGHEPTLVGLTFHDHGDFERAAGFLSRPRPGGLLASHEAVEARYALFRCHLLMRRFRAAANAFGELAKSVGTPSMQAKALYHQGQSLALAGNWAAASESFQRACRIDPGGELAAGALSSALRLEWRAGREAEGNSIYQRLLAEPRYAGEARRAALFLAASDLVRGRRDRAERWLVEAAGDTDNAREVGYWRGRAAELAGNRERAVAAYLDVLLRGEPLHPFAQAALARLGEGPMAAAANAAGKRLASSAKLRDLFGASLLLAPEDPAARAVRVRLRGELAEDPKSGVYLKLRDLPAAQWPLWNDRLETPEELLLALGAWPEAAPAVRAHFPVSSPVLGFTGARLLARYGKSAEAVATAEELRDRMPATLTTDMLSRQYQQLLYPLPLRDPLLLASQQRKVDPALLAAVIRAERLSARLASSRAVALRPLDRADLRPEVYIDQVAMVLEREIKEAGGNLHVALLALAAGDNEAILARALCFGPEPEELLTKIRSAKARLYVQSVLTDAAYYRRLYP